MEDEIQYEEEIAQTAILVDESDELVFKPPFDWPEDINHPIYFVAAVFYRYIQDPGFYEDMMLWVKANNKRDGTIH